MLTRFLSALRRFRRAEAGLAAIEFAFVAPVMLLSLLGAIEVSNAMLSDRKATQVASTLADLVSQDTNVTNAEMSAIFSAGQAVLFPVTSSDVGMRVSSIVADGQGRTTVAWSSSRGMAARGTGSSITVPAGMVAAGGSVVFAEISFSHASTFGHAFAGLENFFGTPLDSSMKSGWTISDRFYLRPRRSLTVTRSSS
jgi:Flp pilus assembly protein TadG